MPKRHWRTTRPAPLRFAQPFRDRKSTRLNSSHGYIPHAAFCLKKKDGQGDPHFSFAFGAARAVVEVDTDLGLVRVLQLAVAQDVGRALHPRSMPGRVEGGSAQG